MKVRVPFMINVFLALVGLKILNEYLFINF